MSGPDHLAVYGTLRPGSSNAVLLDDVAGTWHRGRLHGTRYDEGWQGYPGVVLGGDRTFDVDVLHAPGLASHLERLDAFEGPGYRRVVAPVTLEDGRTVDAWVYELVVSPG